MKDTWPRFWLKLEQKTSPSERYLFSFTKKTNFFQPIAVIVDDAKDVAAFADFVFGGPAPAPAHPNTAPAASPKPSGKSYPEHVVLDLPSLSPTMETGNVGQWRKKVGDKITAGDALVEIETDKAQMDFECQEEGYLAKILLETGTRDVKVGQPLAVLVQDEALVKDFADFVAVSSAPAPAASAAPSAPTSVKTVDTKSAPASHGHVDLHAPGMPTIPPSVYRLCAENNVDPRNITPTGKTPTGKPFWRKGDVLQYLDDVKSGKISKPAVVAGKEAPKAMGEKVAMEVEINLGRLQLLRDALSGIVYL
jgi:biotin carboxyl carrier protein